MGAVNPTSSFLAAGQMPWKLLRHQSAVVDGRIVPVHLQFSPTNRCNGNCSWCSCYRVDRAKEMPIEEVGDMLRYFRDLGTKAVTITGGGEPTIHKNFAEILSLCKTLGIGVGLVTNGLSWRDAPPPQEARDIVWMRVSAVEGGLLSNPGLLATIARQLPTVAIGVSYTVNGHPDIDNAREVCLIAEKEKSVTHVRFVQELMELPSIGLRTAQESLSAFPKAFFQWRDRFSAGCRSCLISLVKPIVDADGMVYPCCGTQYALGFQKKDLGIMPPSMSMGHWSQFHKGGPFDGGVCKRCYYQDYNVALARMTENIIHEDFV